MRFKDSKFYREYSFSVGVDTDTSTPYVSIPVSNGLVDYEEYYAIPPDWLAEPDHHLVELRQFVEQCRARKMDDRLLQQPGSNRGTPV